MNRLPFVLLLSLFVSLLALGVASAQSKPEFRLGFRALADQIPDVIGESQEDEHWGANGDSLQQTTTGLMVWRKADNWTAFTDGSRTWINGPYGVQVRGNNERFAWEAGYNPPQPPPTPSQPLSTALKGTPALMILGYPEYATQLSGCVTNTDPYWTASGVSVRVVGVDGAEIVIFEKVVDVGNGTIRPNEDKCWEYMATQTSKIKSFSVVGIWVTWQAPGTAR